MNITFGDCIEFISDQHIQKAFVIGEAAHSTDQKQIVVVATTEMIGMVVHARRCMITAAGYHALASEFRERYLTRYPNDLRGLRVVNTDQKAQVVQIIKDWFYPGGGDRYSDGDVIADEILEALRA